MNMHPWYWFWKTLLHVTISTFFDVRIYGKENVPLTGSVLFVSNHQSFLDPPLCGMTLHRECDFMARKTLFDNPGFGRLIRTLNSFPVEENGGDLTTIRTLINRVQQDRAVVVFPEGARTLDGEIHKFKSGFELIARKAKATTVPVAIEGSYAAWARGGSVIFGAPIRLMYGQPISYQQTKGKNKKEYVTQVENQIRQMHTQLRKNIS